MAQNLTTNIIINAKTGTGFGKVGATLTEMGMIVNGISQQLINFGEDSVKVYREYELSMRDAEVALSTTYWRGTQQLQTVMTQLDTAATEWAATTIFHTNDVANAISEAAHAGWDYDRIMTGLPAAMQLAQAGNLDLSDSVNYLVKATSAAGVGFEDIGQFIDLWAFASNSSASTIGEFGDAMLRMGSTMRFAANPEELMTLIAVTANAGAVGSEAGTMIRNSIMRLVAPTQKAETAMAELGATTLETAGLMEDEALAAANATLAAHGFSVYDDGGNLRNILDIYHDLYFALGDIAGGFDNIDRNEAALSILSAIFPTRTITEALTLIRAASQEYDGLYDAMMNGEAEGYGEYASSTMMDTLNGSIEIFESKVERLQQLVGGELKPLVETAAEFGGNIIDSIAEMDPGKFSALVDGLTVVAAAGPGLLVAGAAFRLIGLAMTPVGAAALGLTALAAAAVAMKDLGDSQFADNFGSMALDMAAISEYVGTLGNGFHEAYSEVDGFTQAMNAAVDSYQTASTTFSGTLLTNMLTHAQLTDADKAKLTSLGNDMFAAVQEAITNSTAASMSYWQTLFGGDGTAEYDPAYREIIDLTNQAYEDAIAQAEGISEGLREAMTSAFADGEISQEEYQQILSYMQSYNDAIARATAEAQSEEDYIKMQKWLHQAQTASWDEVQGLAQSAAAERDAILQEQEDRYLSERYRLEYRGADAETLAEAERRYQQQRLQTEAAYDEFFNDLWGSQIQQSGQGDNYGWLAGLASSYLNGELSADTALAMVTGELGKSAYAGQGNLHTRSDRAQLGKMLGFWIDSMGGEQAVADRIAYYESAGNEAMAQQLYQMYAMEQLVNGFEQVYSTGRQPWDLLGLGGDFTTTGQNDRIGSAFNRSAAEAVFSSYASDYSVDIARRTVEALGGSDGPVGMFFDAVGRSATGESMGDDIWYAWNGVVGNNEREIQNLMQQLSGMYDLEAVLRDYGGNNPVAGEFSGWRDAFAAWELMYGMTGEQAEAYRFPVVPTVDTSALPDIPPVPMPVTPYVEGTDAMSALQDQGVEVSVGADAQALTATIDGADGQTLLEYVTGDAEQLTMTITAEDGKTLVEQVTGNAAQLAAIINSYNGRTITVNISGRRLFAEGGRATAPSIFGDAGPEWAIPEEHSERTAALLNAARAASGFTWPDLLARFGGMNANPNNSPSTVIYSPVIHAGDASGVAEALKEDKKRLEKWWEERKMRDAMEVYA